jgi:4-carboxymuconolactone decarboxylase
MRLIVLLAAALLHAGAAETQQSNSVAPPAMQAITPALADYTDAVLFGDVWKRLGLNPRDRSLVTVAVLIATSKTAQLEGHLGHNTCWAYLQLAPTIRT